MKIQPTSVGVMLLRSLFFFLIKVFFIDNLESFLIFLFLMFHLQIEKLV